MTKILAGIILALVLLAAGLGYTVKRQAGQVAALEVKQEALSKALNQAAERVRRDRKALVAREAANAAQARKLAQAQEALSEALQRNKTWSDTDVPTDVQEAIVGRSGASDSGPASLHKPAIGEGATKP
jgi:hypothetical protein